MHWQQHSWQPLMRMVRSITLHVACLPAAAAAAAMAALCAHNTRRTATECCLLLHTMRSMLSKFAHPCCAGLPCSVHRYWGHSLYHPADLPYHLWSEAPTSYSSSSRAGASGPSMAVSGERTAALKANAPAAAAAAAAGQAHGLPQLQGGPDCGWVSRETGWLATMPLGVMTDFRRALQAHTRVQPPLPAPAAAGSGSGSGGTDAPVLPPLPPGIAAQAGKGGLLGPLPTDPAAMYAAAGPEAQAALQQLTELTGRCFSDVPPAGSSSWDERSAVPFRMGEQQGLQRLRYYLGLDAGDEQCSSTLGAGSPPPIANYAESRMGVSG